MDFIINKDLKMSKYFNSFLYVIVIIDNFLILDKFNKTSIFQNI